VRVRHSAQQSTNGPHTHVTILFQTSFFCPLLRIIVTIIVAIVFFFFFRSLPKLTQNAGHEPLDQVRRGEDMWGKCFALGQDPVGEQTDSGYGGSIETLGKEDGQRRPRQMTRGGGQGGSSSTREGRKKEEELLKRGFQDLGASAADVDSPHKGGCLDGLHASVFVHGCGGWLAMSNVIDLATAGASGSPGSPNRCCFVVVGQGQAVLPRPFRIKTLADTPARGVPAHHANTPLGTYLFTYMAAGMRVGVASRPWRPSMVPPFHSPYK